MVCHHCGFWFLHCLTLVMMMRKFKVTSDIQNKRRHNYASWSLLNLFLFDWRACYYWFIWIQSKVLPLSKVHIILEGLCEPNSVLEKAVVWQWSLAFGQTQVTCRPEWEGQAELYTSKEANWGMVDLSGKPGALDPSIVTECESRQRKMDQRGSRTKTGKNARGPGPTFCGNIVLGSTSIMCALFSWCSYSQHFSSACYLAFLKTSEMD